MKCEKPKTTRMQEKARLIYDYLKANDRYVEKDELARVIGVRDERTVRDVITYIANSAPIIANSKQSGYKLARKMSDVEAVKRTWVELSSRQLELEKRMKPLIRFCDKAKQKGASNG